MALEDKKIEIYKNLLLGISGVTEAKYLKTVESSVTTSWGSIGITITLLETFCKILETPILKKLIKLI